jgi:hypothetical protein
VSSFGFLFANEPDKYLLNIKIYLINKLFGDGLGNSNPHTLLITKNACGI